MGINQFSLSGSKQNKPGIARSAAENKAISEANKTKISQGSQTTTNTNQPELKEGQLLKGQIVDLRYNEVRIQLEPSKQIVNAKLSGDVPLAIGQEAQFVVTEDSSERLVLTFLPENISASDTTIQKALTASGLPMTDRNRAIVEELLKHTMPVDKQTLQVLIKQSHTNRDASALTLVLMYKNNIPMTSANIKQFEAYQNGTGQLLKDIQSITKNLTELIITEQPQTGNKVTEVIELPQQGVVQDISQANRTLPQTLILNYNLVDLLYSDGETTPMISAPLGQVTNLDGLNLVAATEQRITEQNRQSTNTELDLSWKLLSQLKEGAIPLEDSVSISNPTPDIINTLPDQYSLSKANQNTLAGFINPQEQATLAELLRGNPSLGPIADRVSAGTINTKELLTFLQKALPRMEEDTARTLLTSPEYRKLLESAFHDKWTITPEKLAEKSNVRDLYANLQEDMEKLSSFIKLEKIMKEETRLQEPVKNLQENLRFMKDLNEMFTYLPLPVQLKNQDVHSELYVYNRKKNLQSKDILSVLLHLDMTNLGSMNIHLRLDHNQIQARFYMEDEDAGKLILEHMPSLTEALSKKGYRLHSEVSSSYEKPDFSKDFIEDTVSDGDIKRYTFDIRT